MVISIYKCRSPQENTYFLMTSWHTDALASLKVVGFFWENQLERNDHKNTTFPRKKYPGRKKSAGTKTKTKTPKI